MSKIPHISGHDPLVTLRKAGLNSPKILTFSITGACNLICTHCWVEADTTSSVLHVPPETVRSIILEHRDLGGDGIRFTGGEPLLHPSWLDLVKIATEAGFATVATQTNAILIKDEHVKALRELECPGLVLQISLDGAKASTHDMVRGAGAFEGVMAGIRRLAKGGLAGNISLFFTEMRHNLGEIPELLELAESLGITSVATGGLVICGRADKESLVAPPLPDQYFSLLHQYENDFSFRELYEKIGTTAAIEWLKGDAPRHDSCTFVENPYLSYNGRLYPCVLCHTDEFAVPTVFEKSFAAALVEGAEIWSPLKKISSSRAELLKECRDCPGEASCAGGCMGRAWGSCGDFLAADDRCDLRRAIYTRNANGVAASEK
jgi:radical SAM protein with 4Fe4S-binding SPASM domain